MVIGEVLDAHTEKAKTFMEFGMHCLGCPSARGESIECASEVHGIDADELVDALNKVIG